jgi:ribose transport system substrate-binding protein
MLPTETRPKDRYFIEVVSKALDVLSAFDCPDLELTLTEAAERAQLSRSSTFRLLHTLERKGWVERARGGRKFRRVLQGKRYRIGYAMLSSQFVFSMDVSRGLEEAAERHGLQLVMTDNCYNAEIALINAQMFVKERVDFVIECQAHERIAPVIAHMFAGAGIPCLAIDIPQPGAVFFGADNYQAGLIAGRVLGEHARTKWNGTVDKVLLLEFPQVGPIPQARITGALAGIQEVLGVIPAENVIHIDGKSTLQDSYRITLGILKSIPHTAKLLVAAINDPSAVGAIRAVEAADRKEDTAVVGQNAIIEARLEMRRPDSCLIGSVGYFPERYGEQIVPLILKTLAGAPIPPAVYIEHKLISRENVDSVYPNDSTRDAEAQRNLEHDLIEAQKAPPPVASLFG